MAGKRQAWAAIALLTTSLSCWAAPAACAEDWRTAKIAWPAPVLTRGAEPVSEHVHVIPDGDIPAVANVGIVVGTRAILVIDTSIGRRNGEFILREVAKIGHRDQLLLAATHFHPDHTTGAAAFPANTTIILTKDQEADIHDFGPSMVADFTKISPYFADLLRDSPYPKATISVGGAYDIDLGGGVTVRAIPVGANHTRGDTIFLVEPDHVLFTGDVVMEGAPHIASPYSTISHWLETLDRVDALKPNIIVPDHGPLGDRKLVENYRSYLSTIMARAASLKAEGKTVDETVAILQKKLKPKFEDADYRGVWSWEARMAGSVMQAYKEAPSAK